MTEILSKKGSTTLEDFDGKRRSGKQIVARLMWELAATGKATFPDGTILDASPQDWIGAIKWIYQHIDGPPKQQLEVDATGAFEIVLTSDLMAEAAQCAQEHEQGLTDDDGDD